MVDKDDLLLRKWGFNNIPNKELYFVNNFYEQITFVMDKLVYLFTKESGLQIDSRIYVIGTHVSKSIKLPVYQIDLQDICGITLTLRGNFYDWKLTVESNIPLENFEFFNIINLRERVNSVFCEGFPKDLIYGSIMENSRKFTVEFNDDFNLYTFLYMLKGYTTYQSKGGNNNETKSN